MSAVYQYKGFCMETRVQCVWSFEHFCTSGTSATTYYWFGGALPCQSELIVQYNIGGNLGLNKCHFIPIRTGNCHHVLQQISINSTVRWEIQQDLYIWWLYLLCTIKIAGILLYIFIPIRISFTVLHIGLFATLK